MRRFMEGPNGALVAIVAGWAAVVLPGYFVLGLTDEDGMGFIALGGIALGGLVYLWWLPRSLRRRR